MRAGAVGHAQAGAEVVRIGHAVEHQQQRRAVHRIEHVVERMRRCKRLDARDDALVPMRAAQLVQTLVVAVDQLDAGLLRALDELPHALVAPGGIDVHLEHRARRRLQPHGHRVEAEQDSAAH